MPAFATKVEKFDRICRSRVYRASLSSYRPGPGCRWRWAGCDAGQVDAAVGVLDDDQDVEHQATMNPGKSPNSASRLPEAVDVAVMPKARGGDPCRDKG